MAKLDASILGQTEPSQPRTTSESDWLRTSLAELVQVALHDMRNHMSVIQGWAHLAKLGNIDDSTMAGTGEALIRGVEAQTELIEDLEDSLSDEPEGCQEQLVDLTPLLRELTAVLQPRLRVRGLDLILGLDDLPRPIGAPARRLERLVRRALLHAAHHSPRGGRVELSVIDEPGVIQIIVRDMGPPLLQPSPPHSLERLERAGATKRNRARGLILDLALVRATAEQIGAAVSAESRESDPGVVVTIAIALRENQSPRL